MEEQIVDLEPTPRTRQIQKSLPNGDMYWVDVDEEEIMRTKPEPSSHGHQVSGAFVCTSCGLGFMAQYALAEHITRDHKINSGERDMTIVQVPTGETDAEGNPVLIEQRAFEVPELQSQSKVAEDTAAIVMKKQFLAQNEELELLKVQNAELAQAMTEITASMAEQRAEVQRAENAAVPVDVPVPAPALKPRGRKSS